MPDGSSISRISLKINGTKEDNGEKVREEENGLKKAKESFSYEQLLDAWKAIAASYKQESLALFMAMTGDKPKLSGEHLLIIRVDNAIQQDLVSEKKPEILTGLHKALKNNYIDIKTEIKEKRGRKKAYLPAEKLRELINKNPDIKKLKDELGLDLEY